MTIYYGYPPRKWAELLLAAYGLVLGAYGWAAGLCGDSAYGWAGLSVQASVGLSQMFMLSALLHALGTRINGRWRWSPLLRFVGLSAHMLAISFVSALAVGHGSATTAQPTYTFLLVLFTAGWAACARDAWRAIRGRPQDWTL